MLMPDKLALELHQLDVLTIQLTHDPRVPVVMEEGELFLDVNFVHDGVPFSMS